MALESSAPRRHRRSTTARLLTAPAAAFALAMLALGPAAAQAQSLDVPCTDGVFSGDVSAYYQQSRAAAGPPGSLYDSLCWE
jgi:hypothetical protein